MQLSKRGEDLIKGFEALRLTAYQDQAGIWTAGWGHIGPEVRKGTKVTEKKAQEWFDLDTAFAISAVRILDGSRATPLTQAQFDALVSFEFNTGALSSRKNRVTQHVAACRDDLVDDEMLRWCKVTDPATGKKIESKGLKHRRHAEASLYIEGTIPTVIENPSQMQAATEATAAPVAPPTTAAQAATSPAVQGSAVASIGTVLATATEQIEPLASYSGTLRLIFVALALAGVGLAIWGAMRTPK